MSTKTKHPVIPSENIKPTIWPVRLNSALTGQLEDVRKATGHKKATILKACVDLALPLFLSGQVDMGKLLAGERVDLNSIISGTEANEA